MVYVNVVYVHTKQLLYYRACAFSGLGRRTSYDWWVTASKLCPKTHHILIWTLLVLLFMYSRCGTYSQATPELLNTCITRCDKFASNQRWVNSSLTIVFSIYLVLNTNFLQWKTLLCAYMYISFASPQCDNACFQRWVAVTSNHLHIKVLFGSRW